MVAALEADERLRAGDTTAARSLADSIERIGRQSYYGRDKLLYHHVRGMLFFAQHDFANAERELRTAEWAANGWTRTNIELARAQSAQDHYGDAIATLRDAYFAPLDAMARYVPRSELDWWMARTFAAAGRADSAAVYSRYVRAAWQRADPAIRARWNRCPADARLLHHRWDGERDIVLLQRLTHRRRVRQDRIRVGDRLRQRQLHIVVLAYHRRTRRFPDAH